MKEKTITFKYRIYQYINGLDETIYRAKYKGFLGFYYFFTWSFDPDNILEWKDEKDVIDFLQKKSESLRKDIEERNINKKRYKLKLVIRKDYEV